MYTSTEFVPKTQLELAREAGRAQMPGYLVPAEGTGMYPVRAPSVGRASTDSDCSFSNAAAAAELDCVLAKNKEWASGKVARDPEFFQRLVNTQRPRWLWIGCADSRVPANELLGLGPGEVFVQRNVGNLASHKDMSCMSCLEYAVAVLKVKHVIVCGHYNCGAVRAALTMPSRTPGLVNLWIGDIRDTRDRHMAELRKLQGEARLDRLVELNVMRQVFNVCTSPIVQNAWAQGQSLAVHGMAYRPCDGILQELAAPIMGLEDLERYACAQVDTLSHLSVAALESLSFEREALRRSSLSLSAPTSPMSNPAKQELPAAATSQLLQAASAAGS